MDILQQIIDMDKAAAKRCENTVSEQKRALDEVGEKAASKRENAIAEKKSALESFKKSEQIKLDAKLSKADDYRAEQCSKLDEIFNAHKAQWKDEILSHITEG